MATREPLRGRPIVAAGIRPGGRDSPGEARGCQRPPAGLAILRRAERWHLGFASAVESVGRGAVVLRGSRVAGEAHMRVEQLLERRGGRDPVVVPNAGRLRYEAHPPHRHWHYQPFERYELRRASDFSLVARDRKSGFCLIDRYGTARGRSLGRFGPPRFVSDCAAGQPDAREVVEGSSVGYRDRYPAFFHGQDLDLTGVPAGRYWLVHRANPDRLLRELTYANNAAALLLDLRWTDGVPSVRTLEACEHAERCS